MDPPLHSDDWSLPPPPRPVVADENAAPKNGAGREPGLDLTPDYPRAEQAGRPGSSRWRDLLAPRADAASASVERFMFWIDGVGGYLVCLADSVEVGAAHPNNLVQLPLVGDLSRRHAVLRRDGEDYLLEPLADTWLNGRALASRAVLADGDELRFGSSTRVRFRKPHPLSPSARLELFGRNRTKPWSDAVLLMADSVVMGPRPTSHVVCADWPDDVLFYREESGLRCRAARAIEIDGRLSDQEGPVRFDSRVAGAKDEFSLSLENLA